MYRYGVHILIGPRAIFSKGRNLWFKTPRIWTRERRKTKHGGHLVQADATSGPLKAYESLVQTFREKTLLLIYEFERGGVAVSADVPNRSF